MRAKSEAFVTFGLIPASREKVAPSVDRSSTKPVSLVELSIHPSLIEVEESGVAVRPLGAAGKVLVPPPLPPPPVPRLTVTLSKLAMQTMPSLWLVTARPSESAEVLSISTIAVPTVVQFTPSADR